MRDYKVVIRVKNENWAGLFMRLFYGLSLIVTQTSKFMKSNRLVLDPFGKRQFNNPDYTGTQVLNSNFVLFCYYLIY